MSIRELRGVAWLPAACALSSLACDAPPVDSAAVPEPPPIVVEAKALVAAEPAAAAAEEKARSVLADRLGGSGGAQPKVAEGLTRGDFLVTFERLHTPLVDELLPAVEIFVATLQRRIPETAVVAVDAEGNAFDLPAELDALLRSAAVPVGDPASALKLARLYASLASPSKGVLFPRSWQEVPAAAGRGESASAQEHAEDVQEAEVSETPAAWELTFVSWEQSQGLLVRWHIVIDKQERTIAAESEVLARRVGDYAMDAFY